MYFLASRRRQIHAIFKARTLVRILVLLVLPLSLFARSFGLSMLSQPEVTGPCLMSLVGPISQKSFCRRYADNVNAIPFFDSSRRMVFLGSGDNYLHVIDADSGANLGYIHSSGRVITEPFFSHDGTKLYFGTDKGVLHCNNAF